MKPKSSLEYLNVDYCKIGSPQSIWNHLESTTTDVKRGSVKCENITGTYMVQTNMHKYSFNPLPDDKF